MNAKHIVPMLLCAALAACGGQPAKEDPLRNTRALAKRGAVSLYNNGALEIPHTTIHLIPAAPATEDLALELAGMRARQSLNESLQHTRESADLAKAGVTGSAQAALAIQQGTQDAVKGMHGVTSTGTALVVASPGIARRIVGATVTYVGEASDRASAAAGEFADQAAESGDALGRAAAANDVAGQSAAAGEMLGQAASANTIGERSAAAGAAMRQGATEASRSLLAGTAAVAGGIADRSLKESGKNFSAAWRYVRGYAVVDEKLGRRYEAAKTSLALSKFTDALKISGEWYTDASARMFRIAKGTISNYATEVGATMHQAGKELDDASPESGYTFAMLKSLGWLTQAVLWDATVKPIGKVGGATLGFIAVQGAVIPVVVTREAGAAVDVAVQVSWNVGAGAYDVTAPGAAAAVAGVLGTVDLAGLPLAGGVLAGGTVASAGTYVAGNAAGVATQYGGQAAGETVRYGGEAAGVTLKGGGMAAGKALEYGGQATGLALKYGGQAAGRTVQYVGVPFAAAGLDLGAGAVGVVAGAGAAVAGATIATTGAAAEAATGLAGTTAMGATLVGGTTASVATGVALGTYELSKAVVVPAGHEVGAGMVLSYGTLAQAGAQATYAGFDGLYMFVLSLEGEKWVLYGVKDIFGKGEKLPAGAIVDLKAMREAGATLAAVPASDEKMKQLVDAVPGQLPVTPQVQTAQGETAHHGSAEGQAERQTGQP